MASEMNINSFAEHHRCRQRRDECGDMNIIGKRGTIYEYGDGQFAATVMGAKNALHWNKHREALRAAGCRITQNGDTEGTAVFDPENSGQAQEALSAIRAYRKRKMNPEQRARAIETLSQARSLQRAAQSDKAVV